MQSKKPTTRKARGLGDTIEKVTEVTGIKAVVKAIAGDDCGCEERKQKLNQLFPYYRVFTPADALTYERELAHLQRNDTITAPQMHTALDLYQRYTGRRQDYTKCVSCVLRVLDELKVIHEHTCNDSNTASEGPEA